MTRLTALAAVLLLVLTPACGGAESAQSVLSETERSLGDIRSGELLLALAAAPAGSADGQVGFELEGRFAVAEAQGDLPLADLTYTRITGEQRVSNRFISTGEMAFAQFDGKWEELDESQVASLRVGPEEDVGQGLEGLRLDAWIDDPELRAGPQVGGDETDLLVAGLVDPVAVLNDLVGFASGFENDPDQLPKTLEGEGAERLRRVVSKSEAKVLTGRDDRLLRRADVVLEMRANADAALREALGPLAGVRLEMTVEVHKLNQPISIEPPAVAGPN